MFKIHPLYSSSSGNLFHIESNKTNILIDAGVTYKAINEGLSSINRNISGISAVFITHEHTDHIKGLPILCKKNNIPIYACGKTAEYLYDLMKEKNIKADINQISYGQAVKINDIELLPFETSHDAVMPCGYRIKCDNKTLTYATDLGYVSENVFENLKYSDFIVLEANYDEAMLDFGKYPYELKRRIKGNFGHLSNIESANTIAKLSKENENINFVMAHLSENNNNMALAKATIESVLKENDVKEENIFFATKTLSNEGYEI